MGEKKKKEWKLPEWNLKENLARLISRWSVEFSVFLSLIFTIYNLGLLDFWLLKAYLAVALTGFFVGVMIKFAIAVYKDCAKAIVESNKCIENSKKNSGLYEKTPENHVKEAVKVITENIPKIIPIIAEAKDFIEEAIEDINEETIEETIEKYSHT